jgi:hypothetical protein
MISKRQKNNHYFLTDKPKAGLAKSDATLPHKSQPILGVALLFHPKRAGFASPFLLTEPEKTRVLLFDASLTQKHRRGPKILLSAHPSGTQYKRNCVRGNQIIQPAPPLVFSW